MPAVSARDREDGFTVVELVVACMMMTIVMTMTYLIATTMVKQSVQGTAAGVSSETGQSQMATIDGYLRGAMTPTTAQFVYGVSGLCTGTLPGGTTTSSSTAVQEAYDYYLVLCTAPPRSSTLTCTAANAASSATSCPQLYLLYVSSSSCTTTVNECMLKIRDLTVSSDPTVFSSTVFRCTSTCRSDLGSTTSLPSAHEASGASPAFPYLFTYFKSDGTSQTDGSVSSLIQSIHVDMQVLTAPPAQASSTQAYTEMTDGVWMAGAATPQT
jgi:type II secretory pathway pseudopilin PulG